MSPRHPSEQRLRIRRAFTLTELLVAMGILAVLSLLGLPVLGRLREGGKTVACLSNMRQVGMAVNAWSQENRNLLPPTTDNTLGSEGSWIWQIAPYLNLNRTEERADVLCCPGDPSTAPNAKPRQPRTYRYNVGRGYSGVSFNTPTLATRRSRFDIKNQSTYAMLFDVAYSGTTPLRLWANDTLQWTKPYDTQSFPPQNPGDYPRPHYGGKAINLLFYDGHAARVSYPLPDTAYFFDL